MAPVLPVSNAAMVAILGLLLFGLIAVIYRLLHKPEAELTPPDRLVGYLLLGKHFLRIHARVQAGGFKLGPRMKSALLLGVLGVLAAALLVLGGLSGRRAAAQAKPPAFQITEARTEAAGYAIAHSLLVSNLVRNCVPFRDDLPSDPFAALGGWRQRNAERVDAARAYMIHARAAVGRHLGEAAADDYYAKVTGEFAEQAKNALHDIFGRAGPRPVICSRWTAAINERLADLAQQPKYMPLLDEIVEFHRSMTARQ